VAIHAVNPFGFAFGRRWNENNVDLNRNALLTQEEWDKVKSRDANIAGYQDFNSLFNPPRKPRQYLFELIEIAIAFVVRRKRRVGVCE
jgi:hypothetical protein